MRPLTLDDLLSLEEFAARRGEFFGAFDRYLDRYRRVRVGPRWLLVFENRQTLWFRAQDLLRIARLSDPDCVQQELDIYNRLLPGSGRLQAALVLENVDESRLHAELAPLQALRGEELRLRIGDHAFPADLLTCRPEDRAIGASYWVQFALGAAGRRLLGDPRQPARFEVNNPSYRHVSGFLGEDVRQSLFNDLDAPDDGKSRDCA
jgi:hypothetical protein